MKKKQLLFTNVFIDVDHPEDPTQFVTNKVLGFGLLVPPKIQCLKEIYDETLKASVLKVVIKKSQPLCSFKILFQNSGSMPTEMTFRSTELDKEVSFTIPQAKIYIHPEQRAILEVRGFLKDKDAPINSVYHKMLVANTKDCLLRYCVVV